MLNKHSLTFLALLCTAPAFANVQIESRGLSQGSSVAMNTGANTTTNLNWQLIEKNQQLEADVRNLRGKFEEQENTIEQLKKELENRYNDLDARLEMLQQKVDPQEETPEEDNQQDDTTSGELTTNTALKSQSEALKTEPTTALTQPNDLETQTYTAALDAYKTGGAQKALQPMQQFIQQYPNSAYASNAYFWLGEILLAVEPTDYNAVKQKFTMVVNQYPNSTKASTALYRMFTIASNVDQNQVLAAQFKTKLLNQYPNSEEAKYVK
jgi:TolA-binding protein